MADRTNAQLFAGMFVALASMPEHTDYDRRVLAAAILGMTRNYDFSTYQMYCDAALEKLGLAKRIRGTEDVPDYAYAVVPICKLPDEWDGQFEDADYEDADYEGNDYEGDDEEADYEDVKASGLDFSQLEGQFGDIDPMNPDLAKIQQQGLEMLQKAVDLHGLGEAMGRPPELTRKAFFSLSMGRDGITRTRIAADATEAQMEETLNFLRRVYGEARAAGDTRSVEIAILGGSSQ